MQLQKISTLLSLLNLLVYAKAPLLCANHFFLINHTLKLSWNFYLNESERENFVFKITQLSEVEIQQSFELL